MTSFLPWCDELPIPERTAWSGYHARPSGPQSITYGFLEGSSRSRDEVRAVLDGPFSWSAYCGVTFVFEAFVGSAEIRISFQPGSSWSYVGNWAPTSGATMNFGWGPLESDLPQVGEVRRVVLHEFGHSLGLQHEHESKLAIRSLPWDIPNCRIWCESRGIPWEVFEAQWLVGLEEPVIIPTAYDPDSIMGYYIQPDWMLDRVSRGGAGFLSYQDCIGARERFGPPKSFWGRIWAPWVST